MRHAGLALFSLAFGIFPLASLGCAGATSAPSTPMHVATRSEVDRVLDAFHEAAARSDEEAYFALFAKDGVFLGTDATERWDVQAFRTYAHPVFAKKRGWVMRAKKRNVTFAPGGQTALFDEELETKNLGPSRGSGVLVLENGAYKVLQYNLTITVPNERFSSIKRLLGGPAGPPRTAPRGPADLGFSDPSRAAKVAALGPKLDAIVDREMAEHAPPSLAVALVVDGKIAHVVVRGFADKKTQRKATRETVYRVGSITKTFTATALLLLRDEGKLDLDDRVDAHLPEFANVSHSPTDARPVTLRQLVTHTSGLPRLGGFDYTRPDRDVPEAEVLGALDGALARAPGTEYLYSNFGMSLVGLVVAKASGKGYRDVLRERLFLPLGMMHTAFEPPKDALLATGYASNDSDTPATAWRLGASEGAGGLYASLDDMAKWVAFQEEAWPARDGDDTAPVKRASLRESHMPGVPADFSAEKSREGLKVAAESVGLAWHVKQTCDFASIVEHGGAIDGFHAQIAFAPDRGFGLVVLSNSIAAGTSRIADRILDLVATEHALLPREPLFAHTGLVERWLASYQDPSRETYDAVFSKTFREHVPLAKMSAIGKELGLRHGACKLSPEDTRAESRDEASLRATCEKGALRLHALSDGTAFGGFTVASAGFPVKPNVQRAAIDALALLSHWDQARATKLFASDTKLAKVRAALEAQHEDGGRCTLGTGDGNGEEDARFPLQCERGRPMVFSVGLQKDGKISTLLLTPRTEPRARCR